MKLKQLATLLLILTLFSTTGWGAAYLMPPPKAQFFDSNGNPCSGCKIYTYQNSTSTLKSTYTSNAMTVANTNPVILNSRGEATNGIWLSGSYSIKLTTAGGTTIWTTSDIIGVQDLSAIDATTRWQASYAPTYVSTTQFSVAGDRRSTFPVGRRVQVIGSSTVYGRVSAVAYSTVTTVTVSLDSGTIDTGIGTVNVSLETPTNSSISADMIASGTTSANIITSGTISSSGTNTWGGTQNFTGGVSSSGTNTFSGTTSMTGTKNFSGTTSITGTQNFSGTTAITGTLNFSGTTAITSSGTHTIDGSTIFNALAGTAPFSVPTSTTKVTNLNANYLDGETKEQLRVGSSITGTVPASTNWQTNYGGVYLWGAIAGGSSPHTVRLYMRDGGVDYGDKVYVGYADIANEATNASQWNTHTIMTGSVSWDPSSIAQYATAYTDVTVSGAVTGDHVIITPPDNSIIDSIIINGMVISPNTVRIYIFNTASNARDLASATWRVLVIH